MYGLPSKNPEHRLKGATLSYTESAKKEKRAYPVTALPIKRYITPITITVLILIEPVLLLL